MVKHPDLILKGNVITMVNWKPRVEAIRIKNGKIIAVGSIEEVVKGTPKSTQIIDFKGKTIVPGFIDTHTHLLATGRARAGVDLSSVTSINEAVALIKQRVKITPPGKWVLGWEFNRLNTKEKRFPDIKELDAISPGHPVFIQHYDTHFLMLNSLAFKQLGPSREMEGIVTDDKGEPAGLIEDPASTDLWYKIVGLADKKELLEALRIATRESVSVGITSIYTKESLHDAELILKNQDNVPVRIKPILFFHPLREEDIDKVLRADIVKGKTCVATYADGSIEGHTAALFEPYTDKPETLGMLYYTDEEMYRFVEKAHRTGLQISIHAESERCIEQVLNTYEKVLEKYPLDDHRHRIEHFEVGTKKQIKLAARLGVILAMQPIFITVCEGPNLDYYRSLLGDDRVKRAHTYRTILDEGITVAGGSDTPVTKMSPLKGIHACVNHPLKEQRVDVHEAIEMFTVNAAKAGFEDDIKGNIEPGKLADFAVLSDDPYRVPREKIKDIEVEATIVGGEVVYQKKINTL
jgi:predicted amidohydrolase YtcJ